VIVEVIAVGTELLIGQIINSNVAYIGQRLADEGFDAHYQVTVGDNLDRLASAITTALGRADAVVLTGGVGPTQDDLTREAICAATGRRMLRDEEHAAKIHERILARRGVVPDSVLRMADYPDGADPLPNTQGVALGVALLQDGKWICAVPGVPREMTAMIDLEVMPRLRAAAGKAAVIRSRVLHTWGYGESQVAEILDDLYEATNPSIAFLISDMEVKVRITAKADDAEAVEALIAPVEADVRSRLGDVVFATDDETNLDVVQRLLDGRTVAIVEAATDGLVTHRLSAVAGFAGGMTVTDAEDAVEAAERARSTFGSDIGLGVSTPRVRDDAGDAATEMTFAVVTDTGQEIREMRFFGVGERARSYAVIAALHVLRQSITPGTADDPDRGLWEVSRQVRKA
jgi:nicotinamide-nucleotide amidase